MRRRILKPHVISYRVDDAAWIRLNDLRATFPFMSWPEVYDWLLELPAVREAVQERLEHDGELPIYHRNGDDERDDSVRADLGYVN